MRSLRDCRFYCLAELKEAIGELLKRLNEERPIRRLRVARRRPSCNEMGIDFGTRGSNRFFGQASRTSPNLSAAVPAFSILQIPRALAAQVRAE